MSAIMPILLSKTLGLGPLKCQVVPPLFFSLVGRDRSNSSSREYNRVLYDVVMRRFALPKAVAAVPLPVFFRVGWRE
eukprot:scaffold38993_cov183-Amphora_coffeaeformis.AAC.2